MEVRIIEAKPVTATNPTGKVNHKKRVAAYARVSTEYEEQQSSYETQVAYYTNYIKNNPEWEFVEVYSDEGITGTNTKHREGFNRMIKDAMDGKIDLILTKSISRFARNTVDTLSAVRDLKAKHVAIYFEKENINTLDTKGELLITIMSSLAQEESRSLSENVKWAIKKNMESGKVVIPYGMLALRQNYDTGEIYIIEEEAELVRKIYHLFLSGLSYKAIARQLTEEGYTSPKNGGKFNDTLIKSILTNEKYRGDALLQKTFRESFLTKKNVTNNGEVNQYYISGSHEAVVDQDLFALVQEEVQRRAATGKRRLSQSPFGGKIYCGDCGNLYGPKTWQTAKGDMKVWNCNSKGSKSKHFCGTQAIEEDKLKSLFVLAFNALMQNKISYVKSIKEQLEALPPRPSTDSFKAAQDEFMEAKEACEEYKATHNMTNRNNQIEYRKLKDIQLAKRQIYLDLKNKVNQPETEKSILETYLFDIEKIKKPLSEFDDTVCRKVLKSGTINQDQTIVFEFKDGTKTRVKIEE